MEFAGNQTGAEEFGNAGSSICPGGTGCVAATTTAISFKDTGAVTFGVALPTANTTGRSNAAGGFFTGGTAAVYSNMSAGNAAFGNSTTYPTGQQIVAGVAPVACHFTNLTCINTFHAATCTTAPTVNVFDGGTNTGTAKICDATLDGTRGTVVTQAQTQPIAAGDVYGIYVSTQGGTCLTDQFTVTADISCP